MYDSIITGVWINNKASYQFYTLCTPITDMTCPRVSYDRSSSDGERNSNRDAEMSFTDSISLTPSRRTTNWCILIMFDRRRKHAIRNNTAETDSGASVIQPRASYVSRTGSGHRDQPTHTHTGHASSRLRQINTEPAVVEFAAAPFDLFDLIHLIAFCLLHDVFHADLPLTRTRRPAGDTTMTVKTACYSSAAALSVIRTVYPEEQQ